MGGCNFPFIHCNDECVSRVCVLEYWASRLKSVMSPVNPFLSGYVSKFWELYSWWAARWIAAAELSCILFRSDTVKKVESVREIWHFSTTEDLWSDLYLIVLPFCLPDLTLWFCLKIYLLQTLKAAYEIGGVFGLEYGDNQHAQSSLVSVPPHCHNLCLK